MGRTLLPWLTRLLSLAALCLSAYLLWSSATTETVVGCNAFAEFDCDAALGSRWAKWLGVPVAAGGVLCYAAALAGSLLATSRGGAALGWRLLEAATPLAVGAAVWFTFVQATSLESFCLYCLLTHACGVAMAVAVVLWRFSTSGDSAASGPVGISPIDRPAAPARAAGPPGMGLPTIAGVLGVIALVGGQLASAPLSTVAYEANLDQTFDLGPDTPEAETPPSDEPEALSDPKQAAPTAETAKPRSAPVIRKRDGSRPVKLLGGNLALDTYEHAILGSPEAPHIAVEMMDYACKHCREFHEKLTVALERFDGQVAVIVMPIPGEITCNPFVTKARKTSVGACFAAKLSMAVSTLAPDQFERFHHWMLQDDEIPRRTASLIEARRRVDGDELSLALRDVEGKFAGRLKRYIDLAGAMAKRGKFGLPTQILGDKIVVGPPDSVDELCEAWAKAFDLELPTAEIPF